MSGLLADVYSRSDAFKRKLVDALRNPKETLQNALDDALVQRPQAARQMLSQATDESLANVKARRGMNEGPANQRLAQALADSYNPTGITLWHGSKNPTWIDRGEAFSPNMTANMPSKYMWANPKQDVAKNYAGIGEMQLWKAKEGLGPAPAETAGIRKIDLDDAAKILKVTDVQKAAKQLGTEWGGDNPLENLLDAARAKGFDAVKMEMDGGNIAILNPAASKYGPMIDALRRRRD